MSERQHSTPMLVSKGEAVRLRRIPFDERAFDESWLQDLLFKHPQLIPVDEIEPIFEPLIPVAREVPTAAGPIDLLFVNPSGYLTLVETKLWRNPEARREVVAQIIDYAKEVSRWRYEDLAKAVAATLPSGNAGDPLWSVVQAEEDADQKSFVDTISRNLARGSFLLLIIGDGIHEGAEAMAAFLQQTPGLGFALALVETAVFRLDPEKAEPLLVQPRILAKTVAIERAVVRIEGQVPPGYTVSVEPPDIAEPAKAERMPTTEEAFYEGLATSPIAGHEVVTFVKQFLADVSNLGVTVEWGGAGPALKLAEPTSGIDFSLGALRKDGQIEFYKWIVDQCRRAGIDPELGRRYLEAIHRWVSGSQLDEKWILTHPDHRGWGRLIYISDLIPYHADWLRLIKDTLEGIRAARPGDTVS